MTTSRRTKERPVNICLRLEPSLVDKLETMRLKHHTSRTAIITDAIQMYLDNDGEKLSPREINDRIVLIEKTLTLLTQALSDYNKTIDAQSIMIDKLLNKIAFDK
ncbi:MAG TPA: hypothetical protein O0X42_00155 [Methanocorpusculum sp.]|nr:hypothetical protein [Methanocorpusculum sp.]